MFLVERVVDSQHDNKKSALPWFTSTGHLEIAQGYISLADYMVLFVGILVIYCQYFLGVVQYEGILGCQCGEIIWDVILG